MYVFDISGYKMDLTENVSHRQKALVVYGTIISCHYVYMLIDLCQNGRFF